MNSTESTAITTVSDILATALAEGELIESLSSYVKTVIVTLGVIVNTFGVVGNGLILMVIRREKSMRKPYNALLGSMAVNDVILCGALNMIQVAAIHSEEFPVTWPSQEIMCRVHLFLWTQFIFTSILHIMVITIHRYLMVFHQQLSERITNRRTISLLICVLHVFSVVLLSKQMSSRIRFIGSLGSCLGKVDGYVNLIFLALLIILAISIILYSYIRIHRKVYSAKKQLQLVNIGSRSYANQTRQLNKTTQHMKIIRCMVIILLLFVVGYVPGVLTIWRINKGSDISPATVSTTMLILWISNALNSLVYGVLDNQFKLGFKRLILCNNKINPVC